MVRLVGTFAVLLPPLILVAGCMFGGPGPVQKPQVNIENGSAETVDVFSQLDGTLTLVTTLEPGGLFGSEPAGAECDSAVSYVVQVAGREVARLDRLGCVGGTLVVTPEMLELD